MSTPVLRRLQGLFWDRSAIVRRPVRRFKTALSLAAYRWRAWRGSGEPPRVVTYLADAPPPAVAHPAVAVHARDDGERERLRSWLDGQTETSLTLEPADAPSYWLALDGPLPSAPATLVESLLMAAAAEDLAICTGGWTAPAAGRFGPSGEVFGFDRNEPPKLLRMPAPGPSSAVVGRAVGHVTGREGSPPAGSSPTTLRSGPYLLRPDVRSGQVVRHRARGLDRALRGLPAVPGPRTALFVLPYLAVGGAEHLLFDLLAGLRARYRLLVATFEPHLAHLGQTVDACRELTPWVYTLGDWLPRPAHAGALRHLLRRYRVETLVCWNGTTEFYAQAARLRRELPALRILNQLYNHQGGWIERYGPAFADAVDLHLAVNRRIAEALAAERGVPAERVRVVPHGVRVPDEPSPEERRRRRRASRRELGLPDGALVAGTFVRLHPQKRPLDVLRLARRFADRAAPPVHFLLAGSGPLDAEVDRELARAPLPNLTRLPMQRDVERLYDAVDLCLSTSSYEGLPVFLLESLARGLPCVATAAGDVADLLRDGGGVLVEEAGDLDALAAGVEALLDGERRQAEGRRGRATVVERFGLDAYRRRYETLIFPPA